MQTIEHLNIDNIQETNSLMIANEFGRYLSQVGKEFANKIGESKTPITKYISKIPSNSDTLFLAPTNKLEVKLIIAQLPSKTSSGHDDISNTLLKKLSDHIVVPLVSIFNNSMQEVVVPDVIKIANVVPLHKSKSQDLTNNYRPVSLLITISKILEKIMYKRTYQFLENKDQIYKRQYGFRSKHSFCLCSHIVL